MRSPTDADVDGNHLQAGNIIRHIGVVARHCHRVMIASLLFVFSYNSADNYGVTAR